MENCLKFNQISPCVSFRFTINLVQRIYFGHGQKRIKFGLKCTCIIFFAFLSLLASCWIKVKIFSTGSVSNDRFTCIKIKTSRTWQIMTVLRDFTISTQHFLDSYLGESWPHPYSIFKCKWNPLKWKLHCALRLKL